MRVYVRNAAPSLQRTVVPVTGFFSLEGGRGPTVPSGVHEFIQEARRTGSLEAGSL